VSGSSAPEPTNDAASPETPPNQPEAGADHHGLLTFLGVLALILLFVGAVGASSLPGGGGSDGDQEGAAPGRGNAFGQQKQAEKQQRREERQAEKREQQRQHKERQRELQEQRRGSGATEDVADAISEQTGTVATQTDTDGTTTYVLQTAGGALVLDVGPARYWGDANPLAPLVGQNVTVTGVQKPGSDRFAVFTIGDQVIRGPGRPPWAGGTKANGQPGPMNLPSPSTSPAP
jgi:hypothetical protein